jgi:hypothetical protein
VVVARLELIVVRKPDGQPPRPVDVLDDEVDGSAGQRTSIAVVGMNFIEKPIGTNH